MKNGEFETTILNYREDRGKNKDGRLIVGIKEFPNGDNKEFLQWLGGEFIAKGGLYAVDIINPKGTYRVYKNNNEENHWLQWSKEDLQLMKEGYIVF